MIGAAMIRAFIAMELPASIQDAIVKQTLSPLVQKQPDSHRFRVDKTIFRKFKTMRWSLNTLELAREIVNSLEDKKGEDIVLIDIQEIVSFTDYFVICTGTSDRMIDALANAVLDDIRVNHQKKGKKQGFARDGWVIADFGDVVLHLFCR